MHRIRFAAFVAALLAASPLFAQVAVADAWVRGTVSTQKATGAFMQLTAATDAKLVGASSPAAGVTEIHEMRMDGSVMRMSAIRELALPAGKAVDLKPGGYHVMLMDLKQPLREGETVPITLVIETRDGKRSSVVVNAPVKSLTAPAAHRH
jgi:hypothetical protein